MAFRRDFTSLLTLVALSLLGGCAQRTLLIESQPPGAVVYLNGKEEGRTPMKYDFKFYGDYDVALRHDGFQTLKTHRTLKAPLHEMVPFDLVGEMVGAKDVQKWEFVMTPADPAEADAEGIIERGQTMRGDLKSSKRTRPAATTPTTQAAVMGQ